MILRDAPVRSALTPDVARPTVWGLSPSELHEQFWLCHGVRVVRAGRPFEQLAGADLYLLIDDQHHAVFDSQILSAARQPNPRLLILRIRESSSQQYNERVRVDADGNFIAISRQYADKSPKRLRAALVSDPQLAMRWSEQPDSRCGWKHLRKFVDRDATTAISIHGFLYTTDDDREVERMVYRLLSSWHRPDAAIARITNRVADVWIDPTAEVPASARIFGPVWVGAGRKLERDSVVIGPAVLWDDPERRPPPAVLTHHAPKSGRALEPARQRPRRKPRRHHGMSHSKRLFDLLFAMVALLLTLPFWPLVMLAIWLEDGGPVFFSHRRLTIGGREFSCHKFRSMRRDAEEIRRKILHKNEADGPQFFIKNDPRLLRVGRILRRLNIDEWPQFWNILTGDMSVVGPRPCPNNENQFCPAWREARLSVRPGLTGLWQVNRTRDPGKDFQEWILYDIQYVENASFILDIRIIMHTGLTVLGVGRRRE